jgi:hypothetical protein
MRSIVALALALALVAACDKGAADPHAPEPHVAAPATVTLTAVTIADDCGGTPPTATPPTATPPTASAAPAAPSVVAPGDLDESHVRRRCEQTSMQLAVAASSDAVVRVKSVEVFDEGGKKLGVLEARSPTRWSSADAIYQPWDQTVAAGQTALVSYVLQQPLFISRHEERDRTYTVKVIASVGGVDQPLQTSVMIVAQPPPVPT